VSAVHTVPFQSAWRTRSTWRDATPSGGGDEGGGRFNFLSTFADSAYRTTAGLAPRRGRWLDAADRRGRPGAVVNEALARVVWPTSAGGGAPRGALGQCLH
jgi:hypothetical protein